MRASAHRKLRKVFLAVVIAGAGPAPISGRGIAPAEVACQSGTCCEEPKSLCIIGSWMLLHKYAKAEGSCAQVLPNPQG